MKNCSAVFLFLLLFLNGHETLATNMISFEIEMPSWVDADKILPKYTKFTVVDMKTGRMFRAQRRAGSSHADVQPLTPKDTKIMKKIYGGKWSWKRRSIYILYQNRLIAASMHGMPHGGGALKNNFPGHFCIHFYGSSTHRSNSVDLSHQLMILKAGGHLEEYLNNASPYDIIHAYIIGLKQQDSSILSQITLQPIKWRSVLNRVENIRINRMPLLPAEDLTDQISISVPVTIEMQLKNRGNEQFHGEIHLVRFSTNETWKIDSAFLKNANLMDDAK
ncbi:MAG: hypothetical protein Q8906_04450 [Bacillota bacterium]|nr:hypothetical protein [Bacillota bacterium]MDP4169838.1 hypothetical protein [Bacillota bacterium]